MIYPCNFNDIGYPIILNCFKLYQKKAHKYKIIQTLSSSNFIYSVKYMIMFFIIYLYWTPCFLH